MRCQDFSPKAINSYLASGTLTPNRSRNSDSLKNHKMVTPWRSLHRREDALDAGLSSGQITRDLGERHFEADLDQTSMSYILRNTPNLLLPPARKQSQFIECPTQVLPVTFRSTDSPQQASSDLIMDRSLDETIAERQVGHGHSPSLDIADSCCSALRDHQEATVPLPFHAATNTHEMASERYLSRMIQSVLKT